MKVKSTTYNVHVIIVTSTPLLLLKKYRYFISQSKEKLNNEEYAAQINIWHNILTTLILNFTNINYTYVCLIHAHADNTFGLHLDVNVNTSPDRL